MAAADVMVKLYRVADVSAQAEYTLTDDFRISGLELNGIQSAGEWDVIRSTLEALILANNKPADFTAETNQEGRAQFESLEPGLYLVGSVSVVRDELQCVFDSSLIALPGLDTEVQWLYRVTVTPKPEILPPVTPDEKTEFKILKLWKDDSNRNHRPKCIQAEIFRNGESYLTVTLSEENQWTYVWRAAEDGADWIVVEQNVPKGYTVTVEERKTTFILTNTYQPDEPPEPTPPDDSSKTGDTSNILLHIMLMNISGIGLLVLGMTGKRKHT
jgi:hypothetical protein